MHLNMVTRMEDNIFFPNAYSLQQVQTYKLLYYKMEFSDKSTYISLNNVLSHHNKIVGALRAMRNTSQEVDNRLIPREKKR